jgi:hypothetical protein
VIQEIPPKLSEALVANLETIDNGRGRMLTVFTRLSAAALYKFSGLQMRRSFGGGAQSGAALNRVNTVWLMLW